MKLNSQEIVGTLLILAALALLPAAWIFSLSLGVLALALLIIGGHLLYSERMQKKLKAPVQEDEATQ